MKDDGNILAAARETLTQYLRQRGMRRTPERLAILERVFSADGHLYAESVMEAMEAGGYHVSLSTVYATLRLLGEAGLVRRHQFGDQPAQYERVLPDGRTGHFHLVCTVCGRIREVKDEGVLQQLARRRYPNFQPTYPAVYVYGLCSRCQRRLRKASPPAQKRAKSS